jgi:hypothetical protein
MGIYLTPGRLGLPGLVVVAAILTACGGYGPSEPYPRQTGIAFGSDSAPPNIVGTWRRRINFIDEYGFVNVFETTWTFDAFGNAVRNEVTANVTRGVADTAVTTGVWRFDGPLVAITFLQPSPGQLRMDVLVKGDVMTLGGQEYLRVECCATPR